jgi:hypothetical protein
MTEQEEGRLRQVRSRVAQMRAGLRMEDRASFLGLIMFPEGV